MVVHKGARECAGLRNVHRDIVWCARLVRAVAPRPRDWHPYTEGMSTNLVSVISDAGAIPANRGIDHARRIISAVTIGFNFGAVLGLLFFVEEMTLNQMLLVLIPFAILLVAMFVVWKVVDPDRDREGVDAVARVLATDESAQLRQIKAGGNNGLLVPVVAQPVDGSSAFRSVVLFRGSGSGKEITEPTVGSLHALRQVEVGMGELAQVDEVSDEQRELIDRLAKHPRQLSNTAPVLPIRRGPLERKPRWAAVQWWVSLGAAVVAAILFCAAITVMA